MDPRCEGLQPLIRRSVIPELKVTVPAPSDSPLPHTSRPLNDFGFSLLWPFPSAQLP